jgi:hypothetical protein
VVEATTIDFSCASACTAEKKVAPKSAMKASVVFRRECMCAVLEKRPIRCPWFARLSADSILTQTPGLLGLNSFAASDVKTLQAFGNLADVGALHMSKWG